MKSNLARLGVTLVFAGLLGGCLATTPSPRPDTRIKLVTAPDGKSTMALPPACGDWSDDMGDPWQNESWRNFGCTQARNLALQVERPDDLIAPHELGEADGVTSASAVDRYRVGKTKPLINAKEEAPALAMMPVTASSPK